MASLLDLGWGVWIAPHLCFDEVVVAGRAYFVVVHLRSSCVLYAQPEVVVTNDLVYANSLN